MYGFLVYWRVVQATKCHPNFENQATTAFEAYTSPLNLSATKLWIWMRAKLTSYLKSWGRSASHSLQEHCSLLIWLHMLKPVWLRQHTSWPTAEGSLTLTGMLNFSAIGVCIDYCGDEVRIQPHSPQHWASAQIWDNCEFPSAFHSTSTICNQTTLIRACW